MIQKVNLASRKKENVLSYNPLQYFFKAIFAGMAIDLGMIFSNQVIMSYGKLPGAIVFSLGLLLIIFMGGELFTGNTAVMTIGALSKNIKKRSVISSWIISYIGNFVGCFVIAILFYKANVSGSKDFYINLADIKVATDPSEVLFRAILCNIFVCLAVILGIILEGEVAKILMVVLCISAFITCGFEHCIANMGLFSVALLFKDFVSEEFLVLCLKHMGLVTVGNIIGGAIFVGVLFFAITLRRD